jgi:hypothetical protein
MPVVPQQFDFVAGPNDIPHTDRKKSLSNTRGIRCTVNAYRYFDAQGGAAAK